MDTPDAPEMVDDSVFMIVGQYVHRRTLKRLNLKESAKTDVWKPIDPKVGRRRETSRYREERSKFCEQAFLEFRSRQGEDFARRFAEEMGPFGVRLAKAYRAVARALLSKGVPKSMATDEDQPRTRDDVRILTLLALSAHSRSLSPSDFKTESNQPAGDGEGK